MRIAFHTLGCKLNYAETSTYERQFKAAGAEIVPWGSKDADFYLINTCTVTEHSNQKARGEIRRAHRWNPGAKIIVTGCYAQMRPDEIKAIEGVAYVFGARAKASLVSAVLGTGASSDEANAFPAYSSGERTRSFLKIQDGCSNYCAYCTVPYARGESRNIPICEAVRQAEAIAAEGVKEIVLTGVNTGDFGRTTGESFLDLLKALDKVEGIERYRISSIEPNLITEEIIDWIASGTKFQPHFHIPLQTGCDQLLKAMGRHYDTEFFASRIEYIRKAMEGPGKPRVFFGIDTMVGLPGETEELFMETYHFISRLKPAFIHIFPYSRRPGTVAADMPGQLTEAVKEERVHRLEELCRILHDEFVKSNAGIAEKVLFESTDRSGKMSGYTGNYIRITRDFDPEKVGKIEEVTI